MTKAWLEFLIFGLLMLCLYFVFVSDDPPEWDSPEPSLERKLEMLNNNENW